MIKTIISSLFATILALPGVAAEFRIKLADSWEFSVSDRREISLTRQTLEQETNGWGHEIDVHCWRSLNLNVVKPAVHSRWRCLPVASSDYDTYTDDGASVHSNSSYDIAEIRELLKEVPWKIVETQYPELSQQAQAALAKLSTENQ